MHCMIIQLELEFFYNLLVTSCLNITFSHIGTNPIHPAFFFTSSYSILSKSLDEVSPDTLNNFGCKRGVNKLTS